MTHTKQLGQRNSSIDEEIPSFFSIWHPILARAGILQQDDPSTRRCHGCAIEVEDAK